jgi:hypothetical protein
MPLACANSGVALLLMCIVLQAQKLPAQASRTAAQEPQQTSTGSNVNPDAGRVEVINGSTRWIQELDGQQAAGSAHGRTTYAPAVDKVDVINGSSSRSQVFNADRTAGMGSGQSVQKAPRHRNRKREATEPLPLSNVDIINGARWETRTFEGTEDEPPLAERERRRLRRVVVGVESAESEKRLGNATRVVTAVATTESERERGNQSPVVVAVASSESKSDSGDALPTGFWVEPHPPKRPPYHPNPPSP